MRLGIDVAHQHVEFDGVASRFQLAHGAARVEAFTVAVMPQLV